MEGRQLERTLSSRAGTVESALAAATGRARDRVKNGVVNVVVFEKMFRMWQNLYVK